VIQRTKLAVLGKFAGTTRDTCWVVPQEFSTGGGSFTIQFTTPTTPTGIPTWIAPGPIKLRIRLCDCSQCDALPGTATCPFVGREVSPAQGTCVDTDITYTLLGPEPGAILGDNNGATPKPPGTSTDPGRRQP
jgi:hypothetical protein